MKTSSIFSAILVFIFCIGTLFSVSAQSKWYVSSAGSVAWVEQPVNSTWAKENRHCADFDGDGRADIFILKNGQFILSSAAQSTWQGLNSRFIDGNFSIEDLRFGDFNGDKKMDVFFEWKGNYGYVSGGKGEFIPLRPATMPLKYLDFGDFNRDGKTDIFWVK